MSKSIYLDANGGMPMCHQAMEKYKLATELTNPSNVLTSHGRISNDIYNMSHSMIKKLVGSSRDTLIATGSATEANASILYSLHKNYPCGHVIITSDNHPSITEALIQYNISYDIVEPNIIAIKQKLKSQTIAIMAPIVASLTGKIHPIRSWAMQLNRIDDKYVMICDATQAVGRMPVNRVNLLADYMTFSPHKFGGPQGIGFALISPSAYAREDLKWHALIPGSQQDGMRGGTHNVPGVVASAEALKYKLSTMHEDRKNVLAQTKQLYRQIKEIKQIEIISVSSIEELDKTIGNTLLLRIDTCPKKIARLLSDFGYDIGTGCACQTDQPSDTLRISIPFGQTEPLDELPNILEMLLNGEAIPKDTPLAEQAQDVGTLTPGKPITEEQAIWCAKTLNIDYSVIPDAGLKTWMIGLEIEREHGSKPEGFEQTNVAEMDLLTFGKITLAHLIEIPDYYVRLVKLEKDAEKYWKDNKKPKILLDNITE